MDNLGNLDPEPFFRLQLARQGVHRCATMVNHLVCIEVCLTVSGDAKMYFGRRFEIA